MTLATSSERDAGEMAICTSASGTERPFTCRASGESFFVWPRTNFTLAVARGTPPPCAVSGSSFTVYAGVAAAGVAAAAGAAAVLLALRAAPRASAAAQAAPRRADKRKQRSIIFCEIGVTVTLTLTLASPMLHIHTPSGDVRPPQPGTAAPGTPGDARPSLGDTVASATKPVPGFGGGSSTGRSLDAGPPSVELLGSPGGGLTREESTLDFNELELGAAVGSGTYGTVFRGLHRGAPVALKRVSVQALRDDGLVKYLHRELAALSSVTHPHLIKYLGAAQRGKDVFIVTEFCEGGALSEVTVPPALPLPWRTRVRLARSAAEGLAHLHLHELLHRDIKSDNMLLDGEGRLCIADYGFARGAAGLRGGTRAALTVLGTETHMAPELLFGEPYGEGADVFALGLVLAELITRRTPGHGGFLERGPRSKFAVDVDEFRAAVPPDAPASFVECAVQCLAYNPEDRLGADMVADWLRELEGELPPEEDAPPLADVRAAATAARAASAAAGGAAEKGADDDRSGECVNGR